jgi:hypothetical protein
MKYTLSTLGGSLVSTIAVVLAGHWPALLVVLGFVVGVSLYTWVLRTIGVERYTRWFYAVGGVVSTSGKSARQTDERVSSNLTPQHHPYAGAGHPAKQGTGHHGALGEVLRQSASSGQHHFSNRTGNSERSRPAFPTQDDGYGRTRPVGIASGGAGHPVKQGATPFRSTSYTELTGHAAAIASERGVSLPPLYFRQKSERVSRQRHASERERGKAATRRDRSEERQKHKAYNRTNRVAMLRPVEQDVLSALINLGCSFRQAEDVVQAVSSGPGESFDQLFRKALDAANSGKVLTRKAVA